MRIRIVFSGSVVLILRSGSVRRQFLQPYLVIMQQSAFIIIDENRGCDVHGVDETKSFSHTTLSHQAFDCVRDIHETPAAFDLKPQMLRQRLHSLASLTSAPPETSGIRSASPGRLARFAR